MNSFGGSLEFCRGKWMNFARGASMPEFLASKLRESNRRTLLDRPISDSISRLQPETPEQVSPGRIFREVWKTNRNGPWFPSSKEQRFQRISYAKPIPDIPPNHKTGRMLNTEKSLKSRLPSSLLDGSRILVSQYTLMMRGILDSKT